jgi:hypothetical protein
MNLAVSEFQSVASEILGIDLPESSTSFKFFNRTKGLTPPLNIERTVARKTKKLTYGPESLSQVKRNTVKFQDVKPVHRSLNRSLTTVVSKSIRTIINANTLVKPAIQEIKRVKPVTDPIFFKLSTKLRPKVMSYNVKQLKCTTMVYQNEKGTMKLKADPLENKMRRKNMSAHYFKFQESSEQLLLSTENTLAECYSQSIRLQNNLKRKEQEEKLDDNSYGILVNKLSAVNKTIINEQTRIARSYYSL